ncbi:DegT/DnrJ/EryC1/StrS family aminotransferase [Pelagibius sp.]|uniref:DegT/DnrJ/EryC1/StrS family aminotransferase n=1 Tax=Pelagibius sp. TaxID=1931238 RepID=UPI003B500E7B
MIPIAIPHLVGREGQYLQECVHSGFVSSVGPFVSRFEAMVADAAGASRAVATSAGTTGLHAALVAVGVGRDDLVILPSLTFIASANAIAHTGAGPWLLDVDEATWSLDPALLEHALDQLTTPADKGPVHKETGRRVGAIMPVFCLGLPADMDPIVRIARRFGIPIVVDGAASLGATYRRRPVCQLGADLTVFSFNGNKTVTAGGGGAVAGHNEDLCQLVQHLTTTARIGAEYEHDRVGFNYRMTNLQAAVGCAQLENLGAFLARKRCIRQRYNAAFGQLAAVRPFPAPSWAESACWFSGFILEKGDPDSLRAALRAAGIDARPFWKPIHLQKPYKDAPRTTQPRSEGVWRRIITLPCSTGISDEELDFVITSAKEALRSI